MMLNEGAKDLTIISLDESQFPTSVFTLTFDEKRKLQNFQAAIEDAQKELENLKMGNGNNSDFIAKLNSRVELLEIKEERQAQEKRPSKRPLDHQIFKQSSFDQLISNFGNVEIDDGGIWAG